MKHKIFQLSSQNANYDDLPLDDDEMWIARRQLYCINDNILSRLINGLSVYA